MESLEAKRKIQSELIFNNQMLEIWGDRGRLLTRQFVLQVFENCFSPFVKDCPPDAVEKEIGHYVFIHNLFKEIRHQYMNDTCVKNIWRDKEKEGSSWLTFSMDFRQVLKLVGWVQVIPDETIIGSETIRETASSMINKR